jgi:hypothetical protein
MANDANPTQHTRGVVTHVSPLRVRLEGATTDSSSKYTGSYSPVLGDVVAVVAFYMGTILTLGKEEG